MNHHNDTRTRKIIADNFNIVSKFMIKDSTRTGNESIHYGTLCNENIDIKSSNYFELRRKN